MSYYLKDLKQFPAIEPEEMRSGVCETQTRKKWFKIHFSSSSASSFGPEANKDSQ